MFELTKEEREQLVTICDQLPDTLKHGTINPMVFTELGVAMLSTILKTQAALKSWARLQIYSTYF